MKSVWLMMLLVTTTLQVSSALFLKDTMPPLSSFLPDGNPCQGINCGNGTCVTTNEFPFVKCECKAGWKQPALHHEFPFQPCVIPNCTIDHNCSGSHEGHSMSPSAAPSPSHFKIPSNPFSPCSYSVCGGGSCVLKSNQTYEYECNCFQGYGNIFNWTWGFCAKECELKTDCSRLGVSVSNDSLTTNSSSPSSSSDAIGGLKFTMENRGLVAGSVLATVMMLLTE